MEDNEYIQIQFIQPHLLLKPKHYLKKVNADQLFRKIQTQREKQKQNKRARDKQENIYDKIAYTLQKKLGCLHKNRVSSMNDQVRIKGMIQMCKQQKHVRHRNYSYKSYLSHNNKAQQVTRPRPNSSRPQTSKIKFSSAQTGQLSARSHQRVYSATGNRSRKSKIQLKQDTNSIKTSNKFIIQHTLENQDLHKNQLLVENFQTASRPKKGGLKKCSNRKNSFKKNLKVSIIDQNDIQGQLISLNQIKESKISQTKIKIGKQNSKHWDQTGRKKLKKSANYLMDVSKNLNNILNSCDNQKKSITAINKKVGFFQYYSMRMGKNFQKIKEVLPKKNQFDDLYE